jgi:hypothetical protein
MPISSLLIEALKSKKCVFILGHDAVLLPTHTPVYQKILGEVAATFSKKIAYQKGDEFMYIQPNIDDQVYKYIAKGYQSQNIPIFYKQLAEIPYFMAINTSPDLYLKNIFEAKKAENNGFQFHFDAYQAQAMPENVPKTNDEAPLLYNLFGTTDLPNSMIFSYDKLFNYMDSLMGQKYKLHPSMTSQIRDAESIVFVGLQFNKVYLNMIFWLLNFQGIKYEKYASGVEYPETLEFVKNQFQIEFVNENIPEFIAELHQECKNEGILRTFTKPSKGWEQANENIDLKELLEMLEGLEYTEVFEKLDDLIAKNHKLSTIKAEVNHLRSEFIHGSRDYAFNERLKVLINGIAI